VVAVQSAQAAASYESWKQRRIVELPTTTEAEGLATTTGYELTQSIILENLDDFILVYDAEMRAAVGHYFACCHCLAELSGAAALAGGLKWRDRIAGKKVGVILSGANLTTAQMQRVLSERDGAT
jgi:threonine dehydratase